MTSFLCLTQSRGRQAANCRKHRFSPWSIHFTNQTGVNLIANYFSLKTPCGIRKLTAALDSKRGGFLTVFSRSLDFGAKRQNVHFGSPNLMISKMSHYSNPVDEYSCQNVHIIVYIWSPNLATCMIAKIGGCTRLLISLKKHSHLIRHSVFSLLFCLIDLSYQNRQWRKREDKKKMQ